MENVEQGRVKLVEWFIYNFQHLKLKQVIVLPYDANIMLNIMPGLVK